MTNYTRERPALIRREIVLEIRQCFGASTRRILAVLKWPRSSFYSEANPSPTQIRDAELTELITAIFRDHRKRYGYRRIWKHLQQNGVVCAPSRVRRLVRANGLYAIQPKSFRPQTSDGRADKPSPNLLAQRPDPDGVDQVWTSDLTYIPSDHGWLYLAVVMDRFSRKIIGWSLEYHMRSELVIAAIDQALQSRSPGSYTIFHSDRGSQYSSNALRRKLRDKEIQQSMSGRANPYDNAFTESLIGTLKRELLGDGRFIDIQDARIALTDYIDGYYNTQRAHSSIDYLSPTQFERRIAA